MPEPASVDAAGGGERPPVTLLYLRPSDSARSGIVEYSEHFLGALKRLPELELVDLLPARLTERIDRRGDRDQVARFVRRAAEPYRNYPAGHLAIHAEMGNALHREFWAALFLKHQLPRARLFLTVHDPPTLCSNPYRYVRTEYAGQTPLRLLNKMMTKAAENWVRVRRENLERRFVLRAAAALVLSEGGREALESSTRFEGVAVRQLPHVFGFDSLGRQGERAARREEGLSIGYFGFLGPERGIEELVEAFGLLLEDGAWADVRLRIFGGVLRGAAGADWVEGMRARIGAHPARERIDFQPGFLEAGERDRLLEGVDVLVLPYRHVARVAFSSAGLVRAMGLGKAVVATRGNTVSETLRDGENGLLYPEGSPEALADRLERLLSDAALRERLGRTARETIYARQSEEAVARRLREIYFEEV